MKIWKNAAALLLGLWAAAAMAVSAAAQAPPVSLTEEAFPDPAFLLWVQTQDSDSDGFLSQDELDAVTRMDLRKCGIQHLDGLEYFRNLEILNCSENNLVSLELDEFPALTSLTCNENPSLETLDLSGAPALEHLYCFHSALSQLDLQDVPALTYFAWGGSPLQELDLSGNPELQVLHVLGGDLTSADLSHNPKLDTLLWNHTRIDSLDLSHQTELTYLNCTDNQLTALDLSSNSKLETLYAGRNCLLAIQMPADDLPFCDLTEQRPVSFSLPTGENSLALDQLVSWARPERISGLTGGVMQGELIRLDGPNVTLTYRYQDGSAILDASVSVATVYKGNIIKINNGLPILCLGRGPEHGDHQHLPVRRRLPARRTKPVFRRGAGMPAAGTKLPLDGAGGDCGPTVLSGHSDRLGGGRGTGAVHRLRHGDQHAGLPGVCEMAGTGRDGRHIRLFMAAGVHRPGGAGGGRGGRYCVRNRKQLPSGGEQQHQPVLYHR